MVRYNAQGLAYIACDRCRTRLSGFITDEAVDSVHAHDNKHHHCAACASIVFAHKYVKPVPAAVDTTVAKVDADAAKAKKLARRAARKARKAAAKLAAATQY